MLPLHRNALLTAGLFGAIFLTTPALFAAQNSPVPPAGNGPKTDAHRAVDMHRAVTVRTNAPYSYHFDSDSFSSSSRILPPGTWWKDQELAKRIDLTTEQQKRIADLFLQSKIQLIHLHASLEEEELLLEPMLNANPPDPAKTLEQISKIADTRADLEKANAKMLLGIRGVLNQQQWAKLQQERPAMRLDLQAPFGPHSFDLTLPSPPDTRALMEQMRKNMPNMQKLQREMLREMPQMQQLQRQLEPLQRQAQQLERQLEALPEQAPDPEASPEAPATPDISTPPDPAPAR